MKTIYIKPVITVTEIKSESLICSGSTPLQSAWGNNDGDWHNEGFSSNGGTSTGMEDDNGMIDAQSRGHFSGFDWE